MAATATAIAAVAGAIIGGVSAYESKASARKQAHAAEEQLQQQKTENAIQQQQYNKAQAKKADISGLLESNELSNSTNLTGENGVQTSKSLLSSGTKLLGE